VRTALQLVVACTLAALVTALPAAAEPDPTGPQIEIASPADGWGFYQGEKAQAGYGCYAGSLGWTVITCQGDVPLGDEIDTSSAGTHTFTVHAVDYAGAEATVTHTYTVFDVIPPTATIASPAAGVYPVGAELSASFSCDDPQGSGVVGCIGTYPNGYPLPTNHTGTFTFTVDAYDAAGNHGSASVKYAIADRTPPQITIVSPANGAVYHVGDAITPSFFCHDDTDGSNVPCKATPIDSTPGAHTFRVDSVDSSGNAASASTTYSVRYDFDGFFSPLVAEPSSVTLRAGDSVPVKFSLHGDRGLDVVARAAWRPCGVTTNDSSTASGSLAYNSGPDRYTFSWPSAKSWAGSCREFLLTLRDGTTHAAYISFR
jgi:hypothetical protein